MPLRFNCPSCKANYEVADDLANKMIMCRVCKKRGKVQGSAAQTSSATMLQASASAGAASSAGAATVSRRDLLPLAGLVLASVGAVVTGALLAKQPWERSTEPERGPGRFRKGPPPDGEKKDGKGGTT